MKRTKLRKISKSTEKQIKDKIWQECRRIALVRFCNKDGTIDCYTCNAKDIQGSNRQLGHMWAKASLSALLKFDLRILRWQCMKCNIHYGGQGAIFYAKMLQEIGKDKMKELEDIKNKSAPVKASDHYAKVLIEYTGLST